jgi:hypothetical protein
MLCGLWRCAMTPIPVVVGLVWWVHGLDEINGSVRPNETRLELLAVVPLWCCSCAGC